MRVLRCIFLKAIIQLPPALNCLTYLISRKEKFLSTCEVYHHATYNHTQQRVFCGGKVEKAGLIGFLDSMYNVNSGC